MDIIASAYESTISNFDIQKGSDLLGGVEFMSSVTGKKVLPETLHSPRYWVTDLISPVKFYEAMSRLLSDIADVFNNPYSILEIGPHSTLQGLIREIIQNAASTTGSYYYSLVSRHQPALRCLLRAMGELHALGYSFDISKVNRFDWSDKIKIPLATDLPRYPFDHSKRYWHESRISKDYRLRQAAPHDLLGFLVADWNTTEPRWRNVIRLEKLPFFEDHKISDIIVFPAAAMIAAALEGAHQLVQDCVIEGYEIEDAEFVNALVLSGGSAPVEVELRFRHILKNAAAGADSPSYALRLYSYGNDKWTFHCNGIVRVKYKSERHSSLITANPLQDLLRQSMADFEQSSMGRPRSLPLV